MSVCLSVCNNRWRFSNVKLLSIINYMTSSDTLKLLNAVWQLLWHDVVYRSTKGWEGQTNDSGAAVFGNMKVRDTSVTDCLSVCLSVCNRLQSWVQPLTITQQFSILHLSLKIWPQSKIFICNLKFSKHPVVVPQHYEHCNFIKGLQRKILKVKQIGESRAWWWGLWPGKSVFKQR